MFNRFDRGHECAMRRRRDEQTDRQKCDNIILIFVITSHGQREGKNSKQLRYMYNQRSTMHQPRRMQG